MTHLSINSLLSGCSRSVCLFEIVLDSTLFGFPLEHGTASNLSQSKLDFERTKDGDFLTAQETDRG